MRKINYPYNSSREEIFFLDEYFKIISKYIRNQTEICDEIKKIDSTWSLKKMITAPFSELLSFNQLAENKSHVLKNINNKFCCENGSLYDKAQRDISDFLIGKGIDIKSCHYCNIDYINSFSEEYLYSDFDDLLNYVPKKVMESIKGISKDSVKKIINRRKGNILSEKDLISLFPKIHKNIINCFNNKLNNSINVNFEHFTLDHVLPKGKFAYLSLSIYNLIPSCYSCNSKFKHKKEFSINDDLKKIIPSSQDYNFDYFFEFILKFKKECEIKNIDEIYVDLNNKFSNSCIEEYMKMFRLKGRYEFHKNISYEMINKRKDYPDAQIKEIATLINRDEISVKKDIFGKECFESTNEPFEKYKQDIAKQLGLLK